MKVCTWDIEWHLQAVWQCHLPDIIKSSYKCKQIWVITIVPCCALNFIIFWHITVPQFFSHCVWSLVKRIYNYNLKTHIVISIKHDTMRSEIANVCLLFQVILKSSARNASCIVKPYDYSYLHQTRQCEIRNNKIFLLFYAISKRSARNASCIVKPYENQKKHYNFLYRWIMSVQGTAFLRL